MKVSELLADARDELSMGWEQGSLMNAATGSVCAVGALRRATLNNIQQGSAALFGKARQVLNLKSREMAADVGLLDNAVVHVENFNDWRNTGKQDMLNLFDKAIIGLEEQGQ